MFEKNPLLYISLKYLFFTKDKIVFFMQQFSILVISLSIAVIFAAFSVMNGFEDKIKTKILKQTAPIVVTVDLKDKDDYLLTLVEYNKGFTFDTSQINHPEVNLIQPIKNNLSFLIIDNKNKEETFKVSISEDPYQKETVSINKLLQNKLNNLKINEITLVQPHSFNKNTKQFSKFKSYFIDEKIGTHKSESQLYEVYLSTKEWDKFIGSNQTNKINIFISDPNNANSIKEELTNVYFNKGYDVKTWMDIQPQLINALQLQRKIFWLLYLVMFILLSAVIVSTNIAFFKEKRKDWALLSILNIIPNSVIKIFAYKNIFTFLLTSFIGIILGGLISIYSNEIISFMFNISKTKINRDYFFGIDSITYLFSLKDIILILSFSFVTFLLNFIVLSLVFKKENMSNIIKGN
jgi:lipoprotein-releasing system permease protein